MKKPILGLLLVAALGAAAWWYFAENPVDASSDLVLYGNVDIRETDLAFNNNEHIHQVLVQEGDRVRKGQLLATLHRSRRQAEVNAAAARVKAREAALARLLAGSRPEEIRQATANVAAADARLADARATYERTRDLSRRQAASAQALDDAQAALNTARANLKVAEAALALAEEGPRAEDIEEARAMLMADKAQLELAEEVLADTELHAPADGVIRNRILQPGDMVSPQTPVLTLALTDPVWVRAYAPETVLGKLVLGTSAVITTDSFPDKQYTGWVGYVSPTAEFTPKNVETTELRTRLVYQVRVFVCNPQGELRLGMPATVTIAIAQEQTQTPAQDGQAPPDCARSQVE